MKNIIDKLYKGKMILLINELIYWMNRKIYPPQKYIYK